MSYLPRAGGWLGPVVVAALLLIILLTAGCTMGNSEFACTGVPSRPLCLSAKQIYRLSESDGPPPASEPRPSTLRNAL